MTTQEFDHKDFEAVRRLLDNVQQRYGLSGPKGAMEVTSLVLKVVVSGLHDALGEADEQEASQWMTPEAAQKLLAASKLLAESAVSMAEAVREVHGES